MSYLLAMIFRQVVSITSLYEHQKISTPVEPVLMLARLHLTHYALICAFDLNRRIDGLVD